MKVSFEYCCLGLGTVRNCKEVIEEPFGEELPKEQTHYVPTRYCRICGGVMRPVTFRLEE